MNPKTLTYDICRMYVHDHSGVLGPILVKRILGWIRSRDIDSLASCVDSIPTAFASRELQRCLRQVQAFFKKNALYSDLEVTTEAAHTSFTKAEQLCRITNKRLDHYYINRHRLDADVNLWCNLASRYIERTLGNFGTFMEAIPSLVRVTPGATASHSRRSALPFLKISKKMECTSKSLPYLDALSQYFGYGPFGGKISNENRVEVVPKNWKTGRTIACEPTGNIPLQLAFDTYCKSKLLRRGIDLSDQSRNQRMALESSTSQDFATIDLSMASDTLSFNTVAWLLPEPWFRYLNDIRSPYGRINDKLIKYAKFSSMGNGATFALETLIFSAACYAVGSRDHSVYGDDIIIRREYTEDLLRFMSFLGFVINKDKSFLTGPFRESCGSDCYSGVVITPFYLREWTKVKATICHNVNNLVALSYPGGELWEFCKGLVAELNLPFVPYNNDSMSGIWIDAHHAYNLGLIKTKKQITFIRAYVPKKKKFVSNDIRSLFLWHLSRYYKSEKPLNHNYSPLYVYTRDLSPVQCRSGEVTIRRCLIVSRHPTASHKYVRKWVHWIPPVAATPLHISMWADDLLARASNS